VKLIVFTIWLTQDVKVHMKAFIFCDRIIAGMRVCEQ